MVAISTIAAGVGSFPSLVRPPGHRRFTTNWLTNILDQFADRSPGFYLNLRSTYAAVPGAVILAVGVIANV
jgi:hypothetical protein